MLIVLSPAKSLDYETPPTVSAHTLPAFLPQSAHLVAAMRQLAPSTIGQMMDISENLAKLNAERFRAWQPHFTPRNAKQAVLAFNGDVYGGLDASTLTATQLNFTQKHLRILSGLYGLLRPLDLMQPYRLEMGTSMADTSIADEGMRNLYSYWGETVTAALNAELATVSGKNKKPVLVNLASQEYFKVVRVKQLAAPVITPLFEDWKNGQYKTISFFAKRARGLMARFAITQRISNPEKLKHFDREGYAYAADASDETHWIFRRQLA